MRMKNSSKEYQNFCHWVYKNMVMLMPTHNTVQQSKGMRRRGIDVDTKYKETQG